MPSFRASREMVLAFHGRPSLETPFLFFLAEKLGKSVGEISQLPALELVRWQAYYAARNQQEELAAKVAGRG